MEKYQPFSDKKHGVNPFAPPGNVKYGNIVGRFFKNLCIFPIRALRLGLFAIFFLWLLAMTLLANFFILAPIIKRGIKNYTTNLYCRLFMITIGNMNGFLAKYSVTKPGLRSLQTDSLPDHGDLVFVTYSSIFDLVGINQIKRGDFYFPKFISGHKTGFLTNLALTIFTHYQYNKKPQNEGTTKLIELLHKAKKKKNGPVYVLFEGCPTNGKAILSPNGFYHNLLQSKLPGKVWFLESEVKDEKYIATTLPLLKWIWKSTKMYGGSGYSCSLSKLSVESLIDDDSWFEELMEGIIDNSTKEISHLTVDDFQDFQHFYKEKNRKRKRNIE
ncbi:hypothetical protein PCE1_002137 [Barthelona sp. PCE]